MLPDMSSRMSSSDCAWPSLMRPTAEQIWPGGAVAALEGVVLDEGGLDGVQHFSIHEAFDGGDFFVLVHHGKGEATVDADAVDEDGAGAALAVVAAFFGAGHLEMFSGAEGVEQGDARFEGDGFVDAVDIERDGGVIVAIDERGSFVGGLIDGRRRRAGRKTERGAGGDGGGEKITAGKLRKVWRVRGHERLASYEKDRNTNRAECRATTTGGIIAVWTAIRKQFGATREKIDYVRVAATGS